MDANPGAREHWMVRWTLLGVAGDLATPLLFAALTLVGLVAALLLLVAQPVGLFWIAIRDR